MSYVLIAVVCLLGVLGCLAAAVRGRVHAAEGRYCGRHRAGGAR